MAGHAIGIDLGGTHLRAAVFEADLLRTQPGTTRPIPQPLHECKEVVGERREPEEVARRLAEVIAKLGERHSDITSVGIGLAGMLDHRNDVVANSPHFGWRNVDFRALLAKQLPGVAIVLENDVNAICWGEYLFGAGRGTSSVLTVFVGTGVGAGLVAEGTLLRGASGSAGELGHVKVSAGPSALPCACGQCGCLEAYVGGTYLLKRVRGELAGGVKSAVSTLAEGKDVHLGHVDEAAAQGDEYALSLWQEVGATLGLALANAVTLLNPGRLILGGGVLSRTPVLWQQVLVAMETAVNGPAGEAVTVHPAELHELAGLLGSASLAANL